MAGAESYLHAKFHLDPSNRLATVAYTNVKDNTDKQDRQLGQADNGPVAYGEPFYKRFPKIKLNITTKSRMLLNC